MRGRLQVNRQGNRQSLVVQGFRAKPGIAAGAYQLVILRAGLHPPLTASP
jgi:hypothetical protein